jgi:hypothetical protein
MVHKSIVNRLKIFGKRIGHQLKQVLAKDGLSKYQFSVTIIPAASNARPKHLSSLKVFLMMLTFALLMVVISWALFSFTPFHNIWGIKETSLTADEVSRLKRIESKVQTILKEFDQMKEDNLKLKHALGSGDSLSVSTQKPAAYK